MIQTKESLRAFNTKKHDAVKFMEHKKKSIFVSREDIFKATAEYGPKAHQKYVTDRFYLEHRVTVLDFEKLVFYTTVLDNTMEIAGHTGYSITEPVE